MQSENHVTPKRSKQSTDNAAQDLFRREYEREVFKLDFGPRSSVSWPKSEPVPKSMKEALKNGWIVTGGDEEISGDERTHKGVYYIDKAIFTDRGKIKLRMSVPFHAVDRCQKPREAMATLILEQKPEPQAVNQEDED